ncbi:hypothetical protein M413DRAFT_60265 [Hebeloma cylindrosporum]|uniref:Uncharacterized protein n=1 Tax=Hebeloma cylindrosporum TaxID=76867 RepID=A0A0C2Z9W4_HEBCY|nr:hypothetical protein M413DRAFT_60265 [Hebeloma cylindrosporum h7]
MSRTSASGGGAPSRRTITAQLFPSEATTPWSDLSSKQRRAVLRQEESLYTWKISRSTDAIYASKCESTVYVTPSLDPHPCSECDALYSIHKFQVAINRPMPDETNMKYVPKAYRCPELGEIYLKYKGVRELVEKDDGRSPWLKFAQRVINGDFKSETLLGMVEALVIKSDRLRKGKGLQNMKYSSTFTNFCNLLASTSTRAYQTFRRHFGGQVMSNIRFVVCPLSFL